MGYLVTTRGRLRLPATQENDAFHAAVQAMTGRDGWFHPDDEPATSLADLATYAAASLEREGDLLVLATDEDGDPKWSAQATAFYVALAPFVADGVVTFTGEDEETWTYTYTADGLTQSGVNGWDGAAEPFGEPAPDEQPAPAPAPRARRRWFGRG
ncbi:hypothetical protein [Nocardioides bruguierae]|uniref:hypothetical protein n=1 Tax=Nocardioides bruguierae TaxID=2945102 RepID=UPI0020203944|nr:hypothetical protein [Nocardioides bruguierae]MCL8026493.1 hypothetical protein [Nocardioides bruguierae]